MPLITPKVELALLSAPAPSPWVDVTADVIGGIRIGYGIRGAGPGDRVASSGSCTFDLNNSERNSQAKLGLYSLGSANQRKGFDLGVGVRVQLYDPATATWSVRFRGWVTSIAPTAGQYGARRTQIVATDWIDAAARSTTSGLATQINKRSDEIIALLIANVTRTPDAQSLATGKQTFPYALDTARDDRPGPVLAEIARVTLSELGYFYMKGDGTAVFEARADRINESDAYTFTNTMTDLSVVATRDNLLSKVQVITHPRTVDATATSVLYRLQKATEILAGQTLTIVGGYTDPNNRASRVGGTNMAAPTKGIDYIANAAADGSGADLTDYVVISSTFSGNAVEYVITNTGGTTLYLTKLQAVGRGLYDYEQTTGQAEDTGIAVTYGEQVAGLNLPYLDNPWTGLNLAQYVLALYSTPLVVGQMQIAPTTEALQTQILAREIGDRIAITETVTGVAASYYIQAVDLTVDAPGIVSATWTLAPADTAVYWALGIDGFTELGETTVLSF